MVAELSGPAFETTPEVSGDGLTMYFASDRPGGLGSTDIMVSERPSRGAPWGPPSPVPALSSYTVDGAGGFTADGLRIVIGSERKANTDYDLYESTRRAGGYGIRAISESSREVSECRRSSTT